LVEEKLALKPGRIRLAIRTKRHSAWIATAVVLACDKMATRTAGPMLLARADEVID
jgi:hypothetical protein